MPDTLSRVVGPVALAAATATLYTVPAGATTTIRNLHITNDSAAPVNFTLSIGTDAVGKRFYSQMSLAPRDSLDWFGALVLTAGELLTGFASVAGVATIVATGVVTT